MAEESIEDGICKTADSPEKLEEEEEEKVEEGER